MNRMQDALAVVFSFYAQHLISKKVRGWLYFLSVMLIFYTVVDYYLFYARIHGVEIIRNNIKQRSSANVLLEGIIFNSNLDFTLDFENLANAASDSDDQYTKLMASHPDPGLIRRTSDGVLPIIGDDGREAWQVYARPFNSLDQRNKIAIIVYDVGINEEISSRTLGLPSAVTIGLSVYARDLNKWMTASRNIGHEVLLTLPLQSINYPDNDSGPLTILNDQSDWQVLQKLLSVMMRSSGYVGFINMHGGAVLNNRSTTSIIFSELKNRGLMFVEQPRILSVGEDVSKIFELPFVRVDTSIENPLNENEISALFVSIERAARDNGIAAISVRNYRLIIEMIEKWVDSLATRNYIIVPVSAIEILKRNQAQ